MKAKVEKRIRNSRKLRCLLCYLSSVRVHRRQVSLFRILVIFCQKVKADDVFERAYGVAFNLTLSVFPAIIFLFTLLPYLPFIQERQIMLFLEDIMPLSVYQTASATILDILNRPRHGLLSFGVIFALYLATNGMRSLMNAFNRIFQTRENRSALQARAMATLLTLIMALMLIGSVVMLVVGQFTIKWLYHQAAVLEAYEFYLILFLRFMIMLVGFLFAISAIYYLAPSIHKRWGFISAGSLIAALLCLATSFVFSAYITNFGTYNKLYGSIGAFIALMIWLYMLAVILLLGFTLNASIDTALMRLSQKNKKPVSRDLKSAETGLAVLS
jgi:membrane protein